MKIEFPRRFIGRSFISFINTSCIIFFLLIGTATRVHAQTTIFAQLTGAPVNTTGWTLNGAATIGNVTGTGNSEVIVCPYVYLGTLSGGIFYNQALDLSICNRWIAEFDFRMYDGTQADGIAFCFLDAAPVGTQTGGGIGIPPAAKGLKIVFDTYQNCAPDPVPKIEIRWGTGYDDILYNNAECGAGYPTLNNTTGNLSFLHSKTYNHAKITYDNGNIDVRVNGTLYLSAYQQFNFPGYLGFTASEGGFTDNHSIKNVVIYRNIPVSDAGSDKVICSGGSIQVGTANDPANVYIWSPVAGINDPSLSDPTITLTNYNGNAETHTYYVQTADRSSPGCRSEDTILVTVNPVFTSTVDTIVCIDDLPYLWNGNDYTSAGIYKDTLMSVSGCDSIATLDLMINSVAGACEEYFPSAFTPNGDGLNDKFKILNAHHLTHYSLAVYNRWGERVFQTNDYLQGWDGRLKGKAQSSFVFVYLCTYKKLGKNKRAKGTVVLIR